MLQLNFSIEGEKQLSRVLRNVGTASTNWQPAFRETANKLKTIFSKDVFETQGRAIGEQWQPLSPRYLAQKVKAGKPSDILIRDRKMMNSFVTEAKADYAKVWNTAQYFKYHQSKQPRHHLPRRVMMKLDENTRQTVVKIFHTYWQQQLNAAKSKV